MLILMIHSECSIFESQAFELGEFVQCIPGFLLHLAPKKSTETNLGSLTQGSSLRRLGNCGGVPTASSLFHFVSTSVFAFLEPLHQCDRCTRGA